MSTLIFVPAFCIVAVLVYMARYSGRLRVSQTRRIAAPINMVHALVADFSRWQAWNPWLEHEPDVALKVDGQGVGSALAWDSPRIGAGRITCTRLQAPGRIEQRMQFAQPFRFHGRVRWQLEAQGEETVVTWSLQGRVGFTMRACAKTVQGMVALDFRYGLDRLADTAQCSARPAYEISYLGPRELPALRCAHVTVRSPLDALPTAVPQAVAQVRQQLAGAGLPFDGDSLAIYTRTNVKLRATECRVGVLVDTPEAGPLAVHEVPAQRAYVVRLRGPLSALEVAWYQAMQRLRVEGLEPDLRVAPYERHAGGAPDGGLDTVVDLHVALKALAAAPESTA